MAQASRRGFRTSPEQRYLWSAGRSPWTQLTAMLNGRVDLARLDHAFQSAAARHEILRTGIGTLEGQPGPVQFISDEACGPLRIDRPPAGTQSADLRQLQAAERLLLDVTSGPGLRAAAQVSSGQVALVLTAHPLIADRRSLRVLLTEIASAYDGGAGPPAPVQFADYAAWHNDLLDDDSRRGERGYWHRHASTEPHGEADRLAGPPAPAPGEWRTARYSLGGSLTAALTLNGDWPGAEAVFAAVWALLLWRLRGERAAAVTTILPGRPYQELESAVGLFARHAPVVFELSGDQTLAQLAAKVQVVLSEAADHADDLDPGNLDPAQAWLRPAFEYLDDQAPVQGGGVTFQPMTEECREPALMVLRGGRDATGLWAEIAHDTASVGRERADELLQRFAVMLRAAADAPDTSVAALPASLPGERRALLAGGNGPASRAVPGQTWHGLFADQAAHTPTAVAVQYRETQLTYAELDTQANQCARYLASRGVRAGHRVVLLMERRPELLAAMLGVNRLGAAFIPVDAGTLPQRVQLLVQDANSPLLVTCGRSAADPAAGVPVARLDEDWAEITAGSPNPLPELDTVPRLAYVMYTSGTTGIPNGVQVPHQALVNYLLWAGETYALSTGTGSVVHSPISFDLTVTSLLAPLLSGQRVILVPETSGLGGLAATLSTGRDLTLVKLTPSHLRALAHLLDPADLAGRVRTLVVGGEELRDEVLRPYRLGAPVIRIFNEYGPTETVVGSCAYEVGALAHQPGPIPIGWPIAGTAIYLLDPTGQPVPDGMPGEIYISGAGVSDGYLNRDELTRERFVPDPFMAGQMYRTGDRGLRLPTNALVYLGRTDTQLKIRGIRAEAGEIEAVLGRHPDIAQVAVALRGEAGSDRTQGELRLTAFLVPVPGRAVPAPAELAGFCQQHLPYYLIPAAFVPLTELPVTPNGKLDRAALPAAGTAGAPSEYEPPRTEIEEILAGVLATVLGLDRVGIDDNYFVLGGDSIRSVMVASRAQARGVEVSVADLHSHPTVRELAEAVAAGPHRQEPVTEPFSLLSAPDRALLDSDAEDAFPLSLLQEGMIFHRNFAAKSAVYHAIASVRLQAPFDEEVMRMVIHQLVERHPMLRTSFDLSTFSRPLQIAHKTFPDPLSCEDLRGLSPAEQDSRIARWVKGEQERGFELHEYPLIRFMAQRLTDDSFQFTYGFHHEIVDGWSEALLVTELFGHYFSVIFDDPLEVGRPQASMRDAVALELEALSRPENYEFWDSYLEGATLMRLPRPEGPTADTGAREIVRVAVPVTTELSDGLKRLAVADGVPLKSVLLAAHMMVMCQYGGQLDTLTYTVTNGRPESADGTTAIGLFVNSLAVRLAMTGGSWNDLIMATLEAERLSLPYRRLPMAELKRHQGNEPLAETLFFFTDYHIFRGLERWQRHGVWHVASELYGESTFPFCAIFRLNRDDGRLEIRIEYDSLQFSAELISGIAESYAQVLAVMTAAPESAYHTRSLLPPAELERVVAAAGAASPGGSVPVHHLIEERTAQAPDVIAIESADGAVSYQSLDRLACQVADRLTAAGVGPESIVAIPAERTIATIGGILGILKTGAAYLPLDPAAPGDRIATILADAQPAAVLAPAAHAGQPWPVPVIRLEPGPQPEEVLRRRPGRLPVSPDSAAYVIYTSGSTGQPKGVVITHSALASSTLARGRCYPAGPARFLLLSPLAFDSSVAGLFWTLCEGGTLVLPSDGIQREPAALARLIGDQGVTHTLGIPSLLTSLLAQDQPGSLDSLQAVISAGEPCPTDLLDELRAAVPGASLYNEYGPTENTVWSTVWSGERPADRAQLPIGHPVPGVRLYLLNPHLQHVPAGVAGELYLSGAGLARGYLGRTALTAECFRPDPQRSGERMYRSGDLARCGPNGDVEFLGRVDNQVKIRGYRVEPGEVERLLDTHPGVQRTVVVPRQDAAGEKSLVAYAATGPGATVTSEDLQRYVRERLPKYMVPAACVVLAAMPLTPAGKVDLSALPVPGPLSRQSREEASPQTETEQLIAAIWEQVLEIDNVSMLDEFFEAGGESLRAMQVVTKVNKVFGTDLPVRSLFDAPVMADFAEVVQAEAALG